MSTNRPHTRAPRKALKGLIQLYFGGDSMLEGVLTNVSVTGLAFRTTQTHSRCRHGCVAEIHIRVPGWPEYVAYGAIVRREELAVGQLLGLTFMSLPDELYARLQAHTK